MRTLEISASQLGEVVEGALASQPSECCGVLLGRHVADRAQVAEVIVAENVAAEPRYGYEISPAALVSAQRRARQEGLEVVGYYHSHPGSPTAPSERDRVAAWPEASYLIVSTSDSPGSAPRSWSLGPAGEFEEDEVLVTQTE